MEGSPKTEPLGVAAVAGATQVVDPLVGQRIAGRYELVRLLGRGGMGAVYEGRTADGDAFAVKLIRPEIQLYRGEDAARRFVREAKAAEQIDSPYVARVIDAGADDERGFPFLVMELLCGKDLARLIADEGPLEPAGVVPLFVQACEGLTAAHARGIIHRDIKPANIFVQEIEGGYVRAKLCDFGIAKQLARGEEGGDLTQSADVLGSPMYMSPEQARNAKRVDHRTDVFSLGVSLYEALTGQRPWMATSVGELVLAIWTTDAPPIAEIAPWIAPELAATIHKALARSPDQRYSSSGELGAALRAFGSGPVLRGALRGVSEERSRTVASIRPTVWSETAVATTMAGGATPVHTAAPAAKVRSTWVRAGGIVAAVAVGALAIGFAAHRREPSRWWSGARANIAVPVASSDPRKPCLDWLPGALSAGLTSQLGAGGKVRPIGPHELGELARASSANAKALRSAFGADAVLETSCAGSGGHADGADVRLRVMSTDDPPRELASFHVGGSATAPSDLVARIADELRSSLGLERPDPVEVARAERALPASADAARAYVEGLAKLEAYDATAARGPLEHVVAAEPQFAPAHAALAEAFAYLGQQGDAARESASAAETASSLPNEERLVVEGDAAFAAYSWDQAIETYRAIVKVFPDRTDVALKLVQAYTKTGRAKEARAAIDELMAKRAGETGDPRVYVASANVSVLMGEYAAAIESARRAGALAKAAGERSLEGRAMVAECGALINSSQLEVAAAKCSEAARFEEAIGDRALLVSILAKDAYVDALRGQFDEATALTARALDIATQVDSHQLRALTLIMRANITKRRGDVTATLADARAAIDEARASGNLYMESSALTMLAGTLLDSGVIEESGRAYQQALTLSRKSGDAPGTAVILQNLASYWLLKGDVTRAGEDATEGLETQQRLGDELDLPWSLEEAAEIELEAADPAAARAHVDDAIARRTKLKLPTMASRELLSYALMGLGDLDGALREATAAVDGFHAIGARGGEVEARERLARVLLARGDARGALDALDVGLALAKDRGDTAESYVPVRVRALFLAGRRDEAFAAGAKPSSETLAQRDTRLVLDELYLRTGQRNRAVGDLQALASEAHAAGHVRIERAANALIGGKLDEGFR